MANIIIEHGEGKENANSFVTEDELRDFATLRGVALPDSVDDLLVKSADFLTIREPEFQGSRKKPEQALSFPRKGLTINCEPFPDDKIPPQVKKAQLQAVLEILEHEDLSPGLLEPPVLREKAAIVERQFMTPRQTSLRPYGESFQPEFPKVEAHLFFVLKGNECPGAPGLSLRLVRV